jgi:hypothetical protein
MTNEDRDMLLSLRRQQADLQQMLERLTAQLGAIEARASFEIPEVFLPPVPPEAFLPPLPPLPPPVLLPPIPPAAQVELPPVPLPPPVPAQPRPSFEANFGRWITRVGAGIFVLSLILFASFADLTLHLDTRLGPVGQFGLLGLVSAIVLVVGQFFDRRSFLGRVLVVAGLLGLYYAFFDFYHVAQSWPTPHPILGSLLLLLWTFLALLLAERRKSQALGVLALVLAYVSTAVNPDAKFSMGANLVLAAPAAFFLLRHGWTTLATFGAIGTFSALFQRLVFDSSGDLVLDTSRTLPFLPPAVYVIGAWTIYTAAAILTTSPAFRGGKRLFFASLNNASLAFLLPLSAYIAGYGVESIGWTLFDAGLVLLVVSRFAAFAEIEPVDLMSAYAAQGLALFTAGLIVVFTGVTRAFLLLLETLLLGIAGAFAGDRVLTISAYAAGFFATFFSIWQIAVFAHHPWLLGFGGAAIMLINAWSSRGEVRHSPLERASTVASTACYCLLALALLFAAFSSVLTDASLPAALALGAVVLTFAIYQVSIFELPSLAQILMLAALVLVLFPVETGEELPGWTIASVGLATLLLLTWWSRQRLTRPGAWIGPVSYLYALALTYLAVLTVRPFLDAQDWMAAAALLSAVFLAYGALLRVWPLAITGQILLALSLYHFFWPPQSAVYPWAPWAAALPVCVTYCTARAAHQWLQLFPEIGERKRVVANFIACAYKLVALAGVIRWTFGVIPAGAQMAGFLFFGAFLLAANTRRPETFGARCGLLLSAIGVYLCLGNHTTQATWLNGFAVLLFVAQTPLLDPVRGIKLSHFESWIMALAAVFTGWYFVSAWGGPRGIGHHSHVGLAWAAYALFLFVLGLGSGQGRLRWCGLIVLFAAMLRVLCVDLWDLPSGVRVLTVFLLALFTVGIGLSLVWRNASAPENPPRKL